MIIYKEENMRELKKLTPEQQKDFNKRTIKGLRKIKNIKILDDTFDRYVPSIYKD